MTEIPDHIVRRSQEARDQALVPGYAAVQDFFRGITWDLLNDIVLRPTHQLSDREIRIRNIAETVKGYVAEALGEAMSELAVCGTGHDFRIAEDRADFLQAIQAGGTLAICEFGGEEENVEFFNAVQAREQDQLSLE